MKAPQARCSYGLESEVGVGGMVSWFWVVQLPCKTVYVCCAQKQAAVKFHCTWANASGSSLDSELVFCQCTLSDHMEFELQFKMPCPK